MITDWVSFTCPNYKCDISLFRRVGAMIEIRLSNARSNPYLGPPSDDYYDYVPSGLDIALDRLPPICLTYNDEKIGTDTFIYKRTIAISLPIKV